MITQTISAATTTAAMLRIIISASALATTTTTIATTITVGPAPPLAPTVLEALVAVASTTVQAVMLSRVSKTTGTPLAATTTATNLDILLDQMARRRRMGSEVA